MNQPALSLKPALKPGQQAAADAFFNFLFTSDPYFVISGTAGVGKTFLMSHIADSVMEDYETACKLLGREKIYHSAVFTALTNKAADVLEQSLHVPVPTIHSFTRLVVKQDYKTGKTHLKKRQDWAKRTNLIVFIDECSMIDSQLFDLLQETFENCKIVFVGDHAQMSPVDEALSPIYRHVDNGNFVTLTEPVRNAHVPELVTLCSQFRTTVETGEFRPIKPVPGIIEYLTDAAMEQKLDEYFSSSSQDARVLCYTNARVQQYNDHIRTNVQKLSSHFSVGDILVTGSTYATPGHILNVERRVFIEHMGPIELDEDHNDIFPDNLPIEFQKTRITILATGSCIEVNLPRNRDRVDWAIKHYKKCKDFRSYFELRDRYIDLRDRYASTVYKAQGSTLETVFIDLGNIGTCYKAEQVARMLFVAVSRARSKIFLYGSLPRRYQGA